MGDAPGPIFVLALKDIVGQHARYVSYPNNVFQCEILESQNKSLRNIFILRS